MSSGKKINRDKAKEVLRKYFHGLTDEQFEENAKKYPLNNVLQAIVDFGKSNYTIGVSHGIEHQGDMERYNKGFSPACPVHPVSKMKELEKGEPELK